MPVLKEAQVDHTNIRLYHYKTELSAKGAENQGKPVTSIPVNLYIDMADNEWTAFIDNIERVFLSNGLAEEHALPLLYLISQTNSDIDFLKGIDNEVKDVKVNLTFLHEVLKIQEKEQAKVSNEAVRTKGMVSKEPALKLHIESKAYGKATLSNPAITNFLISKIIEAFKDPSYNNQLASHLQDVELTAANVKSILDNLNYRKSSIEQQCVADTAYRVLAYLNNHTPFSFKGKYASNNQCRFLFDIFQLCNLLKHIIKLNQIPKIKGDLPKYKTRTIKTLLKNHKYVPTEPLYDNNAE